MELINKDAPQVKEFISSLDSMLNGIESIVKHYKPHLNGERFLSNHEVSKKLNVSLRTLQEWRNTGLISFIQIKGKIIYRQSDIDKLLQKHYFEKYLAACHTQNLTRLKLPFGYALNSAAVNFGKIAGIVYYKRRECRCQSSVCTAAPNIIVKQNSGAVVYY